MALTEIRFPDSHASDTKSSAHTIARSRSRTLAGWGFAQRDFVLAAASAVLAVSGLVMLLMVPGVGALFYLLALLSLSGVAGFVIVMARRLRRVEPKDAGSFRSEPRVREAAALRMEREDRREPSLQAARTAVVTRLSESQNETVRAQLEAAASDTAALFTHHVQRLAEALGVEQTKLTEALDLYGQSIQSRLNTSSVSLAREFRDSGELLGRRLETVADTAVAAIGKQGEAIAAAIGRSADEVDRRMIERSREALTQIDAAVARTGQAVAEISETAAARLGRALDEMSERAAANFTRQLEETETRQRDLVRIAECRRAGARRAGEPGGRRRRG